MFILDLHFGGTSLTKKNGWLLLVISIREDINGKKTFSFRHCPNDGGEGSTHARIFWPSFQKCIFGQ